MRKEDVLREAEGRWLDIIPTLAHVDPSILDGGNHPCPKCGGSDRFHLIDERHGAMICRKCFATKNGDGLAAVSWLLNIGFRQATNMVGRYLGLDKPAYTRKSKVQRRDRADELHRAHTLLIARRRISSAHRREVNERGFSNDQIRELGYISFLSGDRGTADFLFNTMGSRDYLSIPGFIIDPEDGKPRTLGDGLGIPVRDIDGKIIAFRIRVDRDVNGGKYRWMSSRSNGDKESPSPGTPPHIPLHTMDDWTEGGEVRITEGEIKADACRVHGDTITTVAIPGVGLWKEIIPVLEKLKPNVARIAYDADFRENGDVLKHALGLAGKLEAYGCRVSFEIWPTSVGKGIDDVLQAGGSTELIGMEEFRELAAETIAESGPNASLDDPDELAKIVIENLCTDDDGQLILRRYQQGWHRWCGKRYKELPGDEFANSVWCQLRDHFSQRNIEDMRTHMEGGKRSQPPKKRKVTKRLIADVLAATQADISISDTVVMPEWIE